MKHAARLQNIQSKSTRGGARPGAGRKKGPVSPAAKLYQEIAYQALQEGRAPLDVLLEAMREAYRKDGPIAAAPYAVLAAPYVHPKLAAIDASVSSNLVIEVVQFGDPETPAPAAVRPALPSAMGVTA